jgi:hypothetical protein
MGSSLVLDCRLAEHWHLSLADHFSVGWFWRLKLGQPVFRHEVRCFGRPIGRSPGGSASACTIIHDNITSGAPGGTNPRAETEVSIFGCPATSWMKPGARGRRLEREAMRARTIQVFLRAGSDSPPATDLNAEIRRSL